MEVNKSTSAVVFFAFLGVVTSLVNLKASVITGTFIKLEWQNDKKEAGMKHEFEVVLEGKRLLTNDTTVKLTSLEPGRRYLIFVNRITEGLVIQQSRTLHLRTALLRLQLQRRNLRVAWDSVFLNNIAVQVTYKVELTMKSRLSSSNYTLNHTKIVNSTVAEILRTVVPDYVRVTVCLQVRQRKDDWSQKICESVTTDPGTPGLINNLQITPDDRSLGLTWEDPDNTPPTGELERVLIEVANTCKTVRTLYKSIHELGHVSGKRSFTVNYLQPDSDYIIKMSAFNKGHSMHKSMSVKTRTLPGVPSSPQALLALPWSSTQVLLSWAPPHEPQGTLLNYTIWVDGKVDTCKEDTLQVHRCTIEGLTPGENYHTEVAACNKLHCSSVVATEVTMPSARVLPVWIPVLFALLLFIVLGLLPFILWRSKKLLERLNGKNRLIEDRCPPAPDGIRKPGEEAVLATDRPAENQMSDPDSHEYESPYTLRVIYTPQVSQDSTLLSENQRQNHVSETTYANIPAVSDHLYANIQVTSTDVISH